MSGSMVARSHAIGSAKANAVIPSLAAEGGTREIRRSSMLPTSVRTRKSCYNELVNPLTGYRG